VRGVILLKKTNKQTLDHTIKIGQEVNLKRKEKTLPPCDKSIFDVILISNLLKHFRTADFSLKYGGYFTVFIIIQLLSYFFQTICHLTQITSIFLLFVVIHLCLKFLARQCVSLFNSTLTDFVSGSLRPFSLFAIFFPDLAFRNTSAFALEGLSTCTKSLTQAVVMFLRPLHVRSEKSS